MGRIGRSKLQGLPSYFRAWGLKSYTNEASYVTSKGSAAVSGDCFYDTTANSVKVFDGSNWLLVITADSSGNVVISGNLQVDGTTTTVNSTTMEVADPNIVLNDGGNQASADDVSGITVEMSDATDAKIIYDKDATSKFRAGEAGTEKEIATTSDTQTLTNKTLNNTNTISVSDNAFTIQDNADATKIVDFELSGLTTATTRTLTVPDASTTIAGTDATQTLTNKTIDGNNNTISNLAHGSEVDNPSSGVHGVTGSVVGTTDTQTLTNKTVVVANNTVTTAASGNLTSTELNAALSELQSDIDTRATSSALTTHISDTTTHGTTGDIVGTSDTQTLTNKTIDGNNNTLTVLAASQLSGATPITNGGTGQTTANAGFNALAPTTTKGDIVAYSTTNARLAVGSNDEVLTADSGETTGLKWSLPKTKDPSLLNNIGLATSVAASALTIDLTVDDGSTDPSSSDPVSIAFRSSTATNGSHSTIDVTAATSITVTSGATLGHASGEDEYIYVYALNNAGTVELAVSTKLYDEGSIVSTTAMSASADTDIIYSTTARSNVAIRLIGRLKSNQTTAGTWAANMSEISLATKGLIAEPYDYIATSSATAASITGTGFITNTMGLTGNSIDLPAGDWRLSGVIVFASSGGTAAYTDVEGYWAEADNSSTEPSTSLGGRWIGFLRLNSGTIDYYYMNAPTLVVRTDVPRTYYLNPYIGTATTYSVARITTFIIAERINK